MGDASVINHHLAIGGHFCVEIHHSSFKQNQTRVVPDVIWDNILAERKKIGG